MYAILSRQSFVRNSILISLRLMQNQGDGESRNTDTGKTQEMPEFSVTVTPYEREGSNIKGLARIYFENSFIVNNVNILQGKEKSLCQCLLIRQSRWTRMASQSIRTSAIRSQRISGRSSTMRLLQNMRKQG